MSTRALAASIASGLLFGTSLLYSDAGAGVASPVAQAAAAAGRGRRRRPRRPERQGLDRSLRRVRRVPAHGADRQGREGPDRRHQAGARVLRARRPRAQRRGQAPAAQRPLGVLGELQVRDRRLRARPAARAWTWCRPPSSAESGHDLASVQLWVEGCKLLKGLDQSACPTPAEWAKQVCRQRAFDNLTANIDRNQGNLLVDGAWNLILIDHSRAFAANRMPVREGAGAHRPPVLRAPEGSRRGLAHGARAAVGVERRGDPEHPQAAGPHRGAPRAAGPRAG